LKEFGYLNQALHLAFDYDLWLRFSSQYEAGMIPGTLSNMRYYLEAKSAKNTKEQLWEILTVGMKYTKPWSFRRLCQYLFYFRGYGVILLNKDISKRIG
jgi:hypothetical protein